jgi:pathogenesis-related protein 1
MKCSTSGSCVLGWFVASFALAGCLPGSAGESGPAENDDTETEGVAESVEPTSVAGVTSAHNKVRAELSQTLSKPLGALVWDAELGRVAQQYADACVYKHSQGEYGENLFAQAGKLATPEEVVGAWAAEVASYDYASGACSGKCGHYTQIVWRDSQRVGCGVASCATGSPFEGFTEWQYWVCNYDPPGNWQGEKPY